MVVDEAHVIEDWENEFRKDYGKLEILKIIMGIEIPWLAVTGTCSSETFETIYRTLGMGGGDPFMGLTEVLTVQILSNGFVRWSTQHRHWLTPGLCTQNTNTTI